jgi:hypothetical protein
VGRGRGCQPPVNEDLADQREVQGRAGAVTNDPALKKEGCLPRRGTLPVCRAWPGP